MLLQVGKLVCGVDGWKEAEQPFLAGFVEDALKMAGRLYAEIGFDVRGFKRNPSNRS